jgi:hypothetical protein
MKYVIAVAVFLFSSGSCYGMEIDLEALEAGTGANFSREVARLKEMGLIEHSERDVEGQIANLNTDQRNRLFDGETRRCAAHGNSFWSTLFGTNHQTDSKALYLLRDLHRLALEEQRTSQTRLEEVEKLARRFKILLVLIGTGLLGSLGANGGFFANLLSGSADAASSI